MRKGKKQAKKLDIRRADYSRMISKQKSETATDKQTAIAGLAATKNEDFNLNLNAGSPIHFYTLDKPNTNMNNSHVGLAPRRFTASDYNPACVG